MRRVSVAMAATVVAVLAGVVIGCTRRRPPPVLDEALFRARVRPMLQRAGCASPVCHGSGLIAMRLDPSGRDAGRDLVEARPRVVAGDPAQSPLYAKALGAEHLGGVVLGDGSCASALLAAWIRGAPAPHCTDEGKRAAALPLPPLPRSLDLLLDGCATAACHGAMARPRMLPPARPGANRVNAAALAPSVDRLQPSRSALVSRLQGREHPRSLGGVGEPAFRSLYAWMAGESAVGDGAPPFERFAREVQPLLVRRGCVDPACHGSAESPLVLLGRPDAAVDDWLRLAPRIAAGLFPAKPQNLLPHGGGRRLGGPDDCAMATVQAWLDGAPPARCTPRPPPDRARYAEVVQPSLEALTCPRCHRDERLGFRLIAHPDAADLERNYRSVLEHIDTDCPTASPVLLRVNEDCMQARLLAWIGGQPDPRCTVDLAHFKGRFPSLAVAR